MVIGAGSRLKLKCNNETERLKKEEMHSFCKKIIIRTDNFINLYLHAIIQSIQLL